MATTKVYVEQGPRRVFAVAEDWPGWCRSATDEVSALERLDEYRDRYAAVLRRPLTTGRLEVVGAVAGNATTDFGAPNVPGPDDGIALSTRERARRISILEDCWAYFDQVVATSSARLARGPRGGGRDRDEVVEHVREFERRCAAKLGAKVAPRTPWDEHRSIIIEALREPTAEAEWSVRYGVQRLAWHVVDHAFEIEDKQTA